MVNCSVGSAVNQVYKSYNVKFETWDATIVMNKKIVKKYIYNGFGFPVELHNIEMMKLEGKFHPNINVRKIAEVVIKSLISQKSRLTGNQIKFIRAYFSMSLREFAKVVNESHMAVKKWEDFQDETTNMDRNIEIMLRLHIYDRVVIKSKDNKNEKVEFYNKFVSLKEMFSVATVFEKGREEMKKYKGCLPL